MTVFLVLFLLPGGCGPFATIDGGEFFGSIHAITPMEVSEFYLWDKYRGQFAPVTDCESATECEIAVSEPGDHLVWATHTTYGFVPLPCSIVENSQVCEADWRVVEDDGGWRYGLAPEGLYTSREYGWEARVATSYGDDDGDGGYELLFLNLGWTAVISNNAFTGSIECPEGGSNFMSGEIANDLSSFSVVKIFCDDREYTTTYERVEEP